VHMFPSSWPPGYALDPHVDRLCAVVPDGVDRRGQVVRQFTTA
jgi:exoribonuclease R